jgi:hypothetical protein
MFGKRVRFLTMLAAAVGIPYAWFNENFAAPAKKVWHSLKGEYSPAASPPLADHPGSGMPMPPGTPGSPSHASPLDPPATAAAPTFQLADVLRFDVNRRWITERWGRVSTVRSDQDLEGLRVPLVTGTAMHDIAGSLTYYFDPQQQVRRITLHGHTGDERPLVGMGSQRFQLRPEGSLAAGMYVMRWNGKPVNVLRITHAPIVRHNSPNARLRVELELNDPGGSYGLSHDFAQLLQSDAQVRRWGQ